MSIRTQDQFDILHQYIDNGNTLEAGVVVDTLRAQRDELLAACKAGQDVLHPDKSWQPAMANAAYRLACAAIARAEK